MTKNDCLFCKIINGEEPCYKVWEDENFLAFLDIAPINPGHILLIPKKHFEQVFDLPNDAYTEIFDVAKDLSHKLRKATSARIVGLAIEGLSIPHVHIHLVPINECNELSPTRAREASVKELEAMHKRLSGLRTDD